MARRSKFRAWPDQRPDPEVEHAFHAHRVRCGPRDARGRPAFGEVSDTAPHRHRGPLADGHRPKVDRAWDEVATWVGDTDAARRRRLDYRGVGPRNYRRSDKRIAEDVNDDLTEDPLLDASDIEVSVRDREVTLDGRVTDRRAKRRAEDCADFVSGVLHVQNNLRIRDPDTGSEAFAPGSPADP